MNTTNSKRTMTNPEAFIGKRMDPNKWNIPAGYGLCRMTQKLHRNADLEVTFTHWKFEDSFLRQHGIYVEDAEALSEEGFDLIRAKLEALGLWNYYLEYPFLPFMEADEPAPAETLGAEYDAFLDSIPAEEIVPFGIGGGNGDMPEEIKVGDTVKLQHGFYAFNGTSGTVVSIEYQPYLRETGYYIKFNGQGFVWFRRSEFELISHAETPTETPAPAQPNANAEIAALVDCLRKYAAAADQIAEQQKALKSRLAELLTERGANWTDETGYARLTRARKRVSYNTECLDALIITEPTRYAWLKDYREETPVKPFVTVK